MAFNATNSTWTQVANKQAYNEMTAGNLNSKTLVTKYDPIYNKLVEQISYTMYRKLRCTQNWTNLGHNAPENAYPGILRELVMAQRKGMNYAMDNETRPTSLNSYAIYDDDIDVRYHSAQLRWMYPWTIYDEELRRFSGGNGTTIAELTEMKMINAINARNLFMDNLRKETLKMLIQNAATPFKMGIDISDFDSLTTDNAKKWLNSIDNLLFTLQVGTSLYNGNHYYMQTPKSDLVVVIPREYYMNVIRKAFPDTYNPESFQNILPDNLILIDTLGSADVAKSTAATVPLVPTWDSVGMNQLNYDKDTDVTIPFNADYQAVIMHRDAMGFEDNLSETLFGPKDIEKLATPVRSHFWTKAYYTDSLPSIVISKSAE